MARINCTISPTTEVVGVLSEGFWDPNCLNGLLAHRGAFVIIGFAYTCRWALS